MTENEVNAVVDAWGAGTWKPFEVGDRVEISVVCFMAPCHQPQGTVIDTTVRFEEHPAVFQGAGAVLRLVPEGEPLMPARTVLSVLVRGDDGNEAWHGVDTLRRIEADTSRDIRHAPAFSGEENISPWGWFAVGGVVAGVMGLGAWLVSRAGREDRMSFGAKKDDLATYSDFLASDWATSTSPAGLKLRAEKKAQEAYEASMRVDNVPEYERADAHEHAADVHRTAARLHEKIGNQEEAAKHRVLAERHELQR